MRYFVMLALACASIGCDFDTTFDPCPGMLTCPSQVCCPIGYPYSCNNKCYTAPTPCGASYTTCTAHVDDDDDDGGSCDLDVTITATSCRFYDHPDPFSSDSWFVDLTGTAKGGESTELAIKSLDAIEISTQCASWSPYASFTCVSKEGESESTTWTSTVEYLHDSSPISEPITATVRGVLSSSCAEKLATQQVSCP